MHIGFDVSQTGSNKAGCGFYAHALARTLANSAEDCTFTFYPSFGDFFFDMRMPLRNPYDAPGSSYGPRHLTRESAATFWNSDGLEAALGNPDLIHANNFWCPLQLKRSRLVYTLYDLAFLVEPAWTTEANRIGCFDGVFRAAMAADWIVAISAASREHFLRVFPHFPPARIRVIHPCSRFVDPDPQMLRPASLRDVAAGAFWLCVGTIEPRKNQRMLAQAYADYLLRGGVPMPLVLAGGNGWLMEDFPEYLEQLGIGSKVILTGYVSDAELVWLYRNCFANLYPSLFEGFGLPVLEGMQFGAASLVSDASSLPEVAGTAAWLLPPEDTRAWTDAMLKLGLETQSREALVQRALHQAAAFDWRVSSRALMDLYQEALAEPRRNF
jgi:glycosyltransferase involved in cell wall biosynthesis